MSVKLIFLLGEDPQTSHSGFGMLSIWSGVMVGRCGGKNQLTVVVGSVLPFLYRNPSVLVRRRLFL